LFTLTETKIQKVKYLLKLNFMFKFQFQSDSHTHTDTDGASSQGSFKVSSGTRSQ